MTLIEQIYSLLVTLIWFVHVNISALTMWARTQTGTAIKYT